jgi:ATP-dependent RNA helicase RhlE
VQEPRSDSLSTGFGRFPFHRDLQRAIADAGYTEPRPIQAATIDAVLAGRDVLGLAQTGTGKTAAFALPILQRLHGSPGPRVKPKGPRALVIAPTRELALQIEGEFRTLGRHTEVRSTTIFGGVSQNSQVKALRLRPEVVVACPGRLLDLFGQKEIDLSAVEVLVLDEADHMFDMGFLPSIRRILAALPRKRQNLLFSATMPKEVRHLADAVLHSPHVVELGNSRPAETIAHALFAVAEDDKQDLLRRLLGGDDFRSAIVFLRTKHRAKRLAKKLDAEGHAAVALQGNMSQNARERAMEGFRDGTYDVLVATDIAARGLDIAGVSHVINFDVPNTPDAYTHRIGRTGRSEQTGVAFTFVTRDDAEPLRAIERRLGAPIERLDPRTLGALAAPAGRRSEAPRPASEPARRDERGTRDSRGREAKAEAGNPRRTAPRRQAPGGAPRRAAAGRVAAERETPREREQPRARSSGSAGTKSGTKGGTKSGSGFGAGLD